MLDISQGCIQAGVVINNGLLAVNVERRAMLIGEILQINILAVQAAIVIAERMHVKELGAESRSCGTRQSERSEDN